MLLKVVDTGWREKSTMPDLYELSKKKSLLVRSAFLSSGK